MVGALLIVLALGVVQLAFALHVRNTVADAAAEGARYAALADATPAEGAQRAEDLIALVLGPGYPVTATGENTTVLGYPAVRVTVSAPLPVIGLVGPAGAIEVEGHAAREVLER